MGDGRAEGSLSIGDGGQAAITLMPDTDGTHAHISESSKLEGFFFFFFNFLFFLNFKIFNSYMRSQT